MAGPDGRGTQTPYAGVTQSGIGYRAMRYGWRREVGHRFNLGVEGAGQGGFGSFGSLDGCGHGGPSLDHLDAGPTHSVQLPWASTGNPPGGARQSWPQRG